MAGAVVDVVVDDVLVLVLDVEVVDELVVVDAGSVVLVVDVVDVVVLVVDVVVVVVVVGTGSAGGATQPLLKSAMR